MNPLKNLLNLKPKDPSDIVYVEKIVLKNRGMFFELSRMLIVIAVASGIVWGVSNADNIIRSTKTPVKVKSFSAVGIVTDVATTTLTIDDANASDGKTTASYTFDVTNVKKIETKDYIPLTLLDISIGDKIIVQGTDSDGTVMIKRIISFSATSSKIKIDVATSTATTTLDLATSTATSTATTTLDVSSSTATTTATSTSIVDTVINTVKDAVQNIFDTVTQTTFAPQNLNGQAGTTTVTSTGAVASTTDSTSSITSTTTDTTSTTTNTSSSTTTVDTSSSTSSQTSTTSTTDTAPTPVPTTDTTTTSTTDTSSPTPTSTPDTSTSST